MIEPFAPDRLDEQRAISWFIEAQGRGLTEPEIYATRPQEVIDQAALQATKLRDRIRSLYPPGSEPAWLRESVQVDGAVQSDHERRLADYGMTVDVALAERKPAPEMSEELWVIWDRNAQQLNGVDSADTDTTD